MDEEGNKTLGARVDDPDVGEPIKMGNKMSREPGCKADVESHSVN